MHKSFLAAERGEQTLQHEAICRLSCGGMKDLLRRPLEDKQARMDFSYLFSLNGGTWCLMVYAIMKILVFCMLFSDSIPGQIPCQAFYTIGIQEQQCLKIYTHILLPSQKYLLLKGSISKDDNQCSRKERVNSLMLAVQILLFCVGLVSKSLIW